VLTQSAQPTTTWLANNLKYVPQSPNLNIAHRALGGWAHRQLGDCVAYTNLFFALLACSLALLLCTLDERDQGSY